MPGLATIVTQTATIETPGGSFEVQGITLQGLSGLMKNHMEPLAELFEGKLKVETIVTEFPEFTAELIAHAANEPDEIEKAKSLTFGVQLIALKTIWELTAVDTEQLGNLLRSLISSMGSLRTQLEEGNKALNSKTGSKH